MDKPVIVNAINRFRVLANAGTAPALGRGPAMLT
ncbi:hypothetical protein M728_004557 (plasmid) [Ensifer sp. WSM1721]